MTKFFKLFSLILLTNIMAISLLLSVVFVPSRCSAKNLSFHFSRTYKNLPIGKRLHYNVSVPSGNYRVRFFSNAPKIASIHKTSGICLAKKAGKVTIKAIVYKGKTKIKTLKTTLRVVKKRTLSNAVFRAAGSINPYNHTVNLSCSRILLRKEVKNSKLDIYSKNNPSKKYSAFFSSLSTDGKKVTYQLSSAAQKRFCPKNGTMDGKYIISSSLFSNKITLSYQERIREQTISGFVLEQNGSPLKNALVTYHSSIKNFSTRTDERGHYSFYPVPKRNGAITVSKENYSSRKLVIDSFLPNRCENFILQKNSASNISLDFHVTTNDKKPISNAGIFLLPASALESHSFSKRDVIYHGFTDREGNLFLYQSREINNAPYSIIDCTSKNNISYQPSYTTSSKQKIKLSCLSRNEKYVALVGRDLITSLSLTEEKNLFSSESNPSSCSFQKITFSPADFISEHLSFQIQLKENDSLSLNNLSIKWDTLSNDISSISLEIYDNNDVIPFFQYTLSQNYFSKSGEELIFSSKGLPLSLTDNVYYFRFQLENSSREIVGSTPVLPVKIYNGQCYSKVFSCYTKKFCRILLHGDFVSEGQRAAFSLYQKQDSSYFYLGKISSDPFQNHTSRKTDNISGKEIQMQQMAKANLFFTTLLPDTTYLLQPLSGNVTGKEYITFTTDSNLIFSTKEEAVSSAPLLQYSCISSDNTDPVPSDILLSDHYSISWENETSINETILRQIASYPNSILVLYKKDGTFLGTSLMQSSFQGFQPSSSIIDLYTNGSSLITNQLSYHTN